MASYPTNNGDDDDDDRMPIPGEATLVGKDGDILGGLFHISDPTAARAIGAAAEFFLSDVRNVGEKYIGLAAKMVAALVMKDAAKAERIGHAVEKAAGYAIVLAPNIIGVKKTLTRNSSELAQLYKSLAPVLKSNGAKMGILSLFTTSEESNEVISTARKRTLRKFEFDLLADGVNLAAAYPQIWIAMQEHAIKKKEYDKKQAESNLSAEEELSRQLQGTSSTNLDDRARQYANDFEAEMAKAGRSAEEMSGWKKDQLKQEFINKKMREHLDGGKDLDAEKLDKWREGIKRVGAPTIGLIRDSIRKQVVEAGGKKYKGKIALDLIFDLEREFKDDPKAQSFTIDGKSMALEECVGYIFQQHQKDMERRPVAPAVKRKFSAACKLIAEDISAGNMHPLALVNLVGEKKIVKEGGRSLATTAQIKEELQKQRKKLSPREKVDLKEFYEQAAFTPEDLQALIQGTKDKEERRLFAVIFPKEALVKAGMAEKEVDESADTTKGSYFRTIEKAILRVAEMTPEELEKAGISEDQAHAATALGEQIESEGQKAVADAVKHAGHDEAISAVQTLLAKEKPGFLHKLLSERKGAPSHDIIEGDLPDGQDKEKKHTNRGAKPLHPTRRHDTEKAGDASHVPYAHDNDNDDDLGVGR